jgi:hypothetical protein
MSRISSRDFARTITARESLEQRLGDALRFRRGTVPGEKRYIIYAD